MDRRQRLRSRLAPAVAAACVPLASWGCGVVRPRHTLDTGSVEQQIASQLSRRYPVQAPVVSCPTGIADSPGTRFACTAVLDGQTAHISATVTSDRGTFDVVPEEAVIDVASATATLTEGIRGDTHQQATVDCGGRQVLVVPVHQSFHCTASFPGQAPRRVTVTVTDRQGGVRYSLAPAGG